MVQHRSLAFVPEGQVCVESRRDVCRPALTDIVYGVTQVSEVSRSLRTRTSKTKRLALRRWRSSSDDLCASGEQVSPLSLTLLLQEKQTNIYNIIIMLIIILFYNYTIIKRLKYILFTVLYFLIIISMLSNYCGTFSF